eukprot:g78334.t1
MDYNPHPFPICYPAGPSKQNLQSTFQLWIRLKTRKRTMKEQESYVRMHPQSGEVQSGVRAAAPPPLSDEENADVERDLQPKQDIHSVLYFCLYTANADGQLRHDMHSVFYSFSQLMVSSGMICTA